MRSSKTINLAAAIAVVQVEQACNITFAELAKAHSLAVCDGTDLRLRKWVQALGHYSAWELPAEKIEVASKAMLDHGYSPASVNRDISTIGSLYRWAKLKRLSPRGFKSPTIGISRFEEKIRRVHLDKDQLLALKSRALAFKDRRFGVFVSLLIETGARTSELLERNWSEVDLDKLEILAPTTKNGTPRVLFFSQQTADLIRRVYPKRDPEKMLFEGRVPSQPISFRRVWGLITAELGLTDIHMHDMRHAAAANLLRAGVTLGVAAQVLGHDPAVLARRYGHLETATLRRAQEAAWQ